QGETFGFLGFDFRRVRSLRGVWRAQVTPKLTQRTALLGKLREVFRRYQSQPVGPGDRRDQPDPPGVGELLPDRERASVPGVCEAVGRAEGAAPVDEGEGPSRLRLEEVEYGVAPWEARTLRRLPGPLQGRARKCSQSIGHITRDAKRTGERRTGNPSAPFDEAGGGKGVGWVPRQASTLPMKRPGPGGIVVVAASGGLPVPPAEPGLPVRPAQAGLPGYFEWILWEETEWVSTVASQASTHRTFRWVVGPYARRVDCESDKDRLTARKLPPGAGVVTHLVCVPDTVNP